MSDFSPVDVEVARARWRADLLRFDAAERQRIAGSDPSPTALAIAADAAVKEAEATIHLDVADAEERLAAAKGERDADPTNEAANRRLTAAARDLADLRAYWRGIGEATGKRTGVMTVDNFPEPTNEEVIASHGGIV